jgi:hypothetical protein
MVDAQIISSTIDTTSRPIQESSSNFSRFDLERITDFMYDQRAIGYRAISIGGADGSFEPLAETIVRNDLETQLAAVMQNGEILYSVFDALFPKRETLKLTAQQGMMTMPLLLDAYTRALPQDIEAPVLRSLASILAELTATALRPLNLILPFAGLVSLSEHSAVFPTISVILESARVKRISDILEAMKLEREIGRVKTLSGAALYSALMPMFARAGRLLLQTTAQELEMQDSFLLLKYYVTRDDRLPRILLKNPNLEAMATNLTLVLAACSVEDREMQLPEYYFERALSDTLLRLKELKRFSTKHISEVREWFTHHVIFDTPGQKVSGLVFGRNLLLENKPQVTIFSMIGTSQRPLWSQTPYPVAENRVEPVLSHLFTTELRTEHMIAVTAGVATYATDLLDKEPTVFFTCGATELDLFYYAAALSRMLILTQTDDGYSVAFYNEDIPLNYDTKSIIVGTKILSHDPAEGVIHTGLFEQTGTGAYPTRIQGVPETTRSQLFYNNPDSFTLSLGLPINLTIESDSVALNVSTSLAKLLVLPEQLRLSVTKQLAAPPTLQHYVNGLLKLADTVDITMQTGEIARLRAATALTNVLLSVGASPAGKALTRSVMIMAINTLPRDQRLELRGRLRNANLAFTVAMAVGGEILSALEYLNRDQVQAILDLAKAQKLAAYMLGSIPNLSDLV